MKKIVFLSTILVLFTIQTNAQQKHVVTKIRTVTTKSKLHDSTTVVLDVDGKRLPYEVWSRLSRSGEYILKRNSTNSPNEPFRLLKATIGDQMRSYESIREAKSEKLKNGVKFDITPFLNFTNLSADKISEKVIVFYSWNTHCNLCTEIFKDLNEIESNYKNSDEIIFISASMDSKENMKKYFSGNPLNFNNVSEANSVLNYYPITSYPTFIVTDKSGMIRFSALGIGSATLTAFKNSIKSVMEQ